jgi:DNA-binding GntR family transcriptional regulator
VSQEKLTEGQLRVVMALERHWIELIANSHNSQAEKVNYVLEAIEAGDPKRAVRLAKMHSLPSVYVTDISVAFRI